MPTDERLAKLGHREPLWTLWGKPILTRRRLVKRA
jgi:hypothetical protein